MSEIILFALTLTSLAFFGFSIYLSVRSHEKISFPIILFLVAFFVFAFKQMRRAEHWGQFHPPLQSVFWHVFVLALLYASVVLLIRSLPFVVWRRREKHKPFFWLISIGAGLVTVVALSFSEMLLLSLNLYSFHIPKPTLELVFTWGISVFNFYIPFLLLAETPIGNRLFSENMPVFVRVIMTFVCAWLCFLAHSGLSSFWH